MIIYSLTPKSSGVSKQAHGSCVGSWFISEFLIPRQEQWNIVITLSLYLLHSGSQNKCEIVMSNKLMLLLKTPLVKNSWIYLKQKVNPLFCLRAGTVKQGCRTGPLSPSRPQAVPRWPSTASHPAPLTSSRWSARTRWATACSAKSSRFVPSVSLFAPLILNLTLSVKLWHTSTSKAALRI